MGSGLGIALRWDAVKTSDVVGVKGGICGQNGKEWKIVVRRGRGGRGWALRYCNLISRRLPCKMGKGEGEVERGEESSGHIRME